MSYKRRKRRKSVGRILIIFSIILILSIIVTYIFRNEIISRILDKRIAAIEQRYNIDIKYNNLKLSGLSTLHINSLTVVPLNSDTLAVIDSLSVNIKPLDIVFKRLRFNEVKMANAHLTLYKTDEQSNYLFLFAQKKDSTDLTADTTVNNQTDYSSRVNVMMKALFGYVPAKTYIRNFNVSAKLNSNYISFSMPAFEMNDHQFQTIATVVDDTIVNKWNISGHINSDSRDLRLMIYSVDSLKVRLPYIRNKWNAYFAFDTASIELNYQREDEFARISGRASISSPVLNHPRISPDDIELTGSNINYTFNIGKSYIEVDSSSYVTFNETGFHPHVRYSNNPKTIALKINEPSFDAQQFFNSLPAGLFSNLQGIKVRGDLSFFLNFRLQLNQPDSLLFSSQLRGIGFAVERFGKTNFTYINEPFMYSAYEGGKVVRQFMVGEENPDFRYLYQIPEYLKHAIMTSEDGQFYYHNGFVPDAIRHSIITNIKEKRFARGGSTISMQLVKNVFLNRNKNITRKLEEMLITWLIESRQMASKDRMLEVYLNIIETGPMTYGVNEAAHFYFKKDVSKLTLAESIYIASIVPRPKLFRYSFDKEGNLREYLSSYYSLVSGKMLNRGWITQEEYDNLRPEITLMGPARGFIVTDTVPAADEIIKERRGFLNLFNLDIFKRKKR